MSDCDTIGGFPFVHPDCRGCGKPLTVEDAWMTDGCPCNSELGINNFNETRWRLLMQLQQNQSRELTALRAQLDETSAAIEGAVEVMHRSIENGNSAILYLHYREIRSPALEKMNVLLAGEANLLTALAAKLRKASDK